MKGELPEGWEWKRLGDITKIQAGGTPRRGVQEYWTNGSIPWVKISDLREKYIETTSERITDSGVRDSSAKIFPKGTILLSIFATLGDIGILKIDATCNQAIAGIIIEDKNVDPIYLYYVLKNLKSHFEQIGRGVAQNNINQSILKDTIIPLPPLPIQHQIVAVLEQAEAVKRQRHEADALTGALLQSVFYEMFGDPVRNERGWQENSLGEICSEIYRYPTFYGFSYSESGTPVVRIANIRLNGGMDPNLDSYVFIEKEISEKFPRTIIDFHDILMAVRGDGSTVKRIGIVDTPDLIGANMSPNLIRIKANQKLLDPFYLFHLMTSNSGQKLLEKYVSRTAKKTITGENIKQISIPLPPLALQQQFARIVQDVERLREKQVASGKEIEGLCEGLMARAFKGELSTGNA